MYCPTCGSEERQLSQYCRACGTDLRVVRRGLERPDAITASAVSAREQISQAMAEKIRQMESAQDLRRVAEDVLPQIEKFLESPEEKRLRRIRAGVITAAAGLGTALVIFLASLEAHDLIPFIALGLIAFLVGIGIVINGLVFTVPRKTLADRSADAESQRQLEATAQGGYVANQLSGASQTTNDLPSPEDRIAARSSVTEHTTHQLNRNNSLR
ncbi:MAG TPA: zinc ribbon domain-containing protein [Pyrinomonadaceae bacterium]|nr:zinc ribbon domain-containing protein [Pyrinomonadaceae bacterium]